MSEGIYTPPPPPPLPPVTPPPQRPSNPNAYDFVKPFTFVFDDPEWLKKILIGGLFYLAAFVLIGIPFLGGYLARLIRNVIAGVERPLPEWDDLGEYFSEGLRLVGVGLCFMLPLLVVMGLMVIPLVLAGNSGSDAAQSFAGVGASCVWCLVVPLSLVLAVFMPAVYLRVVVTQRFGAAFEFGEIWNFVRGNFTNYVLALLVYMVANFASQLGVIALCIGIIFTAFWSVVVTGYAFAQTYRLSPIKW